MNLREKIKQKFGTVSAFARAAKIERPVIDRTIKIIEEKGPSQFRSQNNYDMILDLIKNTKPEIEGKKITNDMRHSVASFFRKNKISIHMFSIKYDISRSLIYQIIRGEYMNITPKVEGLFNAMKEHENSRAKSRGLKASTDSKGDSQAQG